MSWRRDERGSRWTEQDIRWESRPRTPVWEARRSASPRQSPSRDRHRERFDRERERERRERYDREPERFRGRDRYDKRDRERRRSPRRFDERDIPAAPSPPRISDDLEGSLSSQPESRSGSRDRLEINADNTENKYDVGREKVEDNQPVNASAGDWFCKCGSYNFKRRQVCYRRNCQGKRSEGTVLGVDSERGNISEPNSGITKRLLFRRLDALTTEEKILETLKERCSNQMLDSIVGITIGRETLTGASKCLAYINFNSISQSTAAHMELMSLDPPLEIDGREVLITFYNEPPKIQKPSSSNSSDYPYYAQMSNYNTSAQALSEADRVNAAAAVAQSAISAAQARQMSWVPVSVPVFVSSNSQKNPSVKLPIGDGKTVYTAPDVRTFMYDETSGYYYDPATGLYYDGTTQYFYNSQLSLYMYWDASSSTYIAATQNHQNTDQPKLPTPPEATTENTITKEPEEKKRKDKEDKVKVAKKIAKDMERWARTLNQKKENARSNIVMEQPLDTSASKGSADIGFSVLGAGPQVTHVMELSPPPVSTDDFLVKRTESGIFDSDEGIIDWAKLTCLICKRKLPSAEILTKHKTLSDLHKQNLIEFRKKNELLPQSNGYRDRAAERRMKFGEDEPPPIRKRYEPPDMSHGPTMSHPPPSVVDTIGGKMLQKMGWSEGRGLGKEEQGRIAPIEAEQRSTLAGLGQKRGVYTPTPGETYRDTVKKLMIARYKEVVGQEEGNNCRPHRRAARPHGMRTRSRLDRFTTRRASGADAAVFQCSHTPSARSKFIYIYTGKMNRRVFNYLVAAALCCAAASQQPPPAGPPAGAAADEGEEPPEGYYAFVESPNATPPRVRPPPYRQSSAECAGAAAERPHVSAHNLCGDLNRGVIPRNPLGQMPDGQPYPFELIRNETLRFLSRTLPVLRADEALPRVARLQRTAAPTHATQAQQLPELADNRLEDRAKRSVRAEPAAPEQLPAEEQPAEHRADTAPRESRKFCDGGGVFCMLYRAINGDSTTGPERREDPGAPSSTPAHYEGPPTPCPARVEYATPVFARNYQGVWRYVVQIPYEGYFTQTVEVTRCMQSRCHYLEGGCLSSPRWVSLLVAELHQQPQQPQHPEGAAGGAERAHCDTAAAAGCYQVRLYYDWFLVPGSCKCWRPDYFARYVRRHHEL